MFRRRPSGLMIRDIGPRLHSARRANLEVTPFPLTVGAPSSGALGRCENDLENQLKRMLHGGLAFAEVIPAAGRERRAFQFDGRGAPAHGSDASERQALEFARPGGARRGGEEQLVILAAIQSLAESRAGIDGRRTNFGFHARGAAEAMEVEREAIAQI